MGTYSYSYKSKQWTKVSDAQHTGLGLIGGRDLAFWQAGTSAWNIELRRQGSTQLTVLPPIPYSSAWGESVGMAIDDAGNFFVGPFRLATTLAIAELAMGSADWTMIPLPLDTPGFDSNNQPNSTTLSFDASGTLMFGVAFNAQPPYVAARPPGSNFQTVVAQSTAQFSCTFFSAERKKNLKCFSEEKKRFVEVQADGSAVVLPGEDSVFFVSTSGRVLTDHRGGHYLLAYNGFDDDTWDVARWDGSRWSLLHTTNSDSQLQVVAPNGDLYISHGLNSVTGRQTN